MEEIKVFVKEIEKENKKTKMEVLEKNLELAYTTLSPLERAESYYHGVASEMVTMRQLLDQLEVHIPEDLWEIPSYTKLLLEY